MIRASIALAALSITVSSLAPSPARAMPGAGGASGMHGGYGQPLRVGDLPVGAVTVKVVGKEISDKRVGVAVAVVPVEGGATAAKIVQYTGADGRARFSGLTPGKGYRVIVGAKGAERRSSAFAIPKSGGIKLLMSIGGAPKGAHGTGPKATSRPTSKATGKAGGAAAKPRTATTTDRSKLSLGGGTHLRGQINKGLLSFMQVYELVNGGQAAIDPGPEGIVFPAPERALAVGVGGGSKGLAKVTKDRRGVRVVGLLKPGKTKLHVTFRLATDGPRLDYRQRLGLALGFSLVAIMNNNDLSMVGPGYQRHEMRGETKVFLFKPVKAGGNLEFTLGDIPYHDPTMRNVTLGAAVLLMLWALVSSIGARARREARQRKRDDLLVRLVELAERKEKGGVKGYAQQREKLLAQLRPIWRD
jgi:hypothetical protein